MRIRAGARVRPSLQRRVPRVVVSVTTHPDRIETFRLPLLSLLNQTVQADRVIVSLLEHEFAGRDLPAWIKDLVERDRLTILWTNRDLRSYAKLIPTLAAYPDATIVTADDDVLYPASWLSGLLRAASERPGAVVGYRARPALKGTDGRLRPYVEWTPESLRYLDLGRITAADVMLTGVGGILYPPRALPELALDADLARALCPTADDVWFWALELYAGAPLALIPPGYLDFAAATGSQHRGRLMSHNVDAGANDIQIAAVLDHFRLWARLGASRPG